MLLRPILTIPSPHFPLLALVTVHPVDGSPLRDVVLFAVVWRVVEDVFAVGDGLVSGLAAAAEGEHFPVAHCWMVGGWLVVGWLVGWFEDGEIGGCGRWGDVVQMDKA